MPFIQGNSRSAFSEGWILDEDFCLGRTDNPFPNFTAVLLVLFMGRRKYHMDNKQHGRNMIISEYIWRRWLALLPPGTKEPSKYRNEDLPDNNPLKWNPWYRWRKQVSSHMQVMKGFFKFHPSCKSVLQVASLVIGCGTRVVNDERSWS